MWSSHEKSIESTFKQRMDNILSPVIIALAVQGYEITQHMPNKNRINFYIKKNGQSQWCFLLEKYKNRIVKVSNVRRMRFEHIHERDLPGYFIDAITDLSQEF